MTVQVGQGLEAAAHQVEQSKWQSGEVIFELRRRAELEMPEYYEMLKTAVDRLERNEIGQRQAVYLNARNALIGE